MGGGERAFNGYRGLVLQGGRILGGGDVGTTVCMYLIELNLRLKMVKEANCICILTQ